MIQDVLLAVVLGSVYFLFAIGMSLTWGTIGIVNFAHGAIFMFSAYAAYVISTIVTLPAVLDVIISTVAGAIISGLVYVLVFQPIQRLAKNARAAELQILIAGIGVGAVAVSIVQTTVQSGNFGYSAQAETQTFEILGLRVTNIQLIILALAVLLSVGIAVWLRRSKQGLALRSIGVDAETASLMGINERRISILVMSGSGALAGLAGALLTLDLISISPTSGDTFLLKAFAVIILGGVGSVAGVAIGCLVLSFAETFIVVGGLGGWSDAVSFALIFLVLLIRPQGLLGHREVRRT